MQSDLIIDVGVHRGEDTEFYLRKGFRVVGIEAYSQAYEAARSRLQRYIDNGQLVLLNIAISIDTGPITFYANLDNSVWGTTSPEWAERNRRLGSRSSPISVPGCRFADVLAEYGIPYFLKVDIEGSDLLCIQALKDFDDKPQFVSIESTKTSWKSLLEEFTLLRKLGYDRFKVVQQERVFSQVCPFPPREGVYVPFQFESGASGLFGEEAPGEWVSEAEALKTYQKIFRRYRMFGDDGYVWTSRLGRALIRVLKPSVGWYDTHARLRQNDSMNNAPRATN